MISPINNTTTATTQVKAAENQQVKSNETSSAKASEKTTQTVNPVSTEAKKTTPTDTLEIGSAVQKTGNYSKPATVKLDMSKVEALQKQADTALQPLRDMVKQLLKEQGKTFREANLEGVTDKEPDSDSDDNTMVTITPEMRAEAQKNIADDGEYGVEKTSDRLFEFAKAISGGDTKKLDIMKKAIQDGYDAAEKAFGGELPDISKKTLELTMKKLDEWASQPTEGQNQTNAMK